MESKTSKGKKCLIYRNNRFYRSYIGKNKTTWRCVMKICGVIIHTSESGDVIESGVNHTHDDSVQNVGVYVWKENCKRKAVDSIDQRPSKIFRTELASLADTHNFSNRDITNCKQAMYKKRRTQMPKLPKTLDECVEFLRTVPMSTSRREDFLMFCEKISAADALVIFTCASNLRQMCNADVILGDGTFFCSA